MNNNFKVAILQLKACNSQEESLNKGIEACKKAKDLGADIAVFPEMWNIGYKISDIANEKIRNQKAIGLDSKYLLEFRELAKELNMAIAITFLEKTNNLPKNSVVIYDRFGNQVLKYSKVHTVDFKLEKYTSPGTDFYVNELNYKGGKVNIGSMICYDRDFPESGRILMLKGAEIILVPNACVMSKIRLDELRVRAYENTVGIVTVNYPNNGGKSSAFSPIVRDKNKNEIDNKILIMDEKENIQLIEFNLNEIRDYRKRETLGDAYRKPVLYKYISTENVKNPFIRTNSRRNIEQ